MSDRSKKIAVIGQGLMGLTCAERLLEAGFNVDIHSKDEFWNTTSTSAGAYWWPHKAYPEERVSKWAKETYEVYKSVRNQAHTGVTFQRHRRFCLDPDDSAYARHLVDEWERIDGHDYGIDCVEAFSVILPVIDVPIYMPFLRNEVVKKGGRIQLRDVGCFTDLFPEYDLIINCTGVGAGELANDREVFSIRGQVIRVSASSEITESTRIYKARDEFTLVLPRSRDIILGGTAQENDWSLEVRDEDTEEILRRCQEIVPALVDCQFMGASVGLRPGRKVIRLELERLNDGKAVIHNYGHGGGGFTVAWGCANEVRDLAEHYFC
ncbi:FAD-dependent oxidoreductase [Haloferula chungangensis]|uniref:D-amino-acid oxidase n=1 Tax=Haloferula chungangensis TaxID=1048331 RepID=A0ABW2LD49_9BACT